MTFAKLIFINCPGLAQPWLNHSVTSCSTIEFTWSCNRFIFTSLSTVYLISVVEKFCNRNGEYLKKSVNSDLSACSLIFIRIFPRQTSTQAARRHRRVLLYFAIQDRGIYWMHDKRVKIDCSTNFRRPASPAIWALYDLFFLLTLSFCYFICHISSVFVCVWRIFPSITGTKGRYGSTRT